MPRKERIGSRSREKGSGREGKGEVERQEELRKRKEEILLSRKKAVERLKVKKSESETQEKRVVSETQRKENEEREKLKLKLKENRQQQVKDTVERTRVIRAMHENPQIFGKSGTSNLRSTWTKMLPSHVESDLLDPDSSGGITHPISSSLIVRNVEVEEIQSQESHDVDELPMTPMSRPRLSSVTQPMPVTSTFLRRTMSVNTPSIHSVASKDRIHEGLLAKFIRPRGHTVDVLLGHNGKSSDQKKGSESPSISPITPSKLIDCLLLAGPSKEDLEGHIERMKNEILGSFSPDTSSSGSPHSSPTPVRTSLIPNVLFMSPPDPQLEAEYLSYSSFPRGVDTTFSCILTTSQRKPSLSKNIATTSPGEPISTDNDSSSITSSNTRCSYEASLFTRFAYLLTDHVGNQLGICLSIPVTFTLSMRGITFTIKTRYCLTILTHFPYIRFFFHVLNEFVLGGGLFTSYSGIISQQLPGDPIQADLRQLENFSSKLFRTSTPKPGKALDLHFTINLTHHEYSMKRFSFPSLEQEYTLNILLWSLPILLKYIPLEQLLLVIGCALTEMYILIKCPDLEVLSACVLGCLALLAPVTWSGPTIVILPPRMHDFIDAPSPIFFGVESTPQNFKMSSGLLLIDIFHKDVVKMHPTDVVASHNFCLPYASKLHASLKPIADNILKLSRKGRNKKKSSQTSSPILGTNLTETSEVAKALKIDEPDDDTVSEKSISSQQFRGPTATFVSSNVTQRSSLGGISQRGSTPRVSSRNPVNGRPISEPFPTLEQNTDPTNSSVPFEEFTNLSPLIQAFGELMRDHIQRLINTAIHCEDADARVKRNPNILTPRELFLQRTFPTEINDGQKVSDPYNPANVFPRSIIGSGSANFLQMFQNTQAFAVFLEKITPNLPSHEGIIRSPVTSSVDFIEQTLTPRDMESSDGNSESGLKGMNRMESQRLTTDPLILLFNMMISGTCPLRKHELYRLEERYLSLYPSDQKSSQFADHSRQNGFGKLNIVSQFFITPSIDTWESVEMKSQFSPEALSLELLERDLWCNGRCGGLANTDKCTNICLHVWEEKMLQLRKQTTALEIVKNNRTILRTQPSHHKDSNLPSHLLAMPPSIKLHSGESIPTQSICPSPPKKHPRETRSQYLHRVSLVAGQVELSEVEKYLSHASPLPTAPETNTKGTRSLLSQSSRLTDANSNQKTTQVSKSRHSAIRSIALHKHRKYVRSCLRRILFVMYRYALRKRFKKYSVFAVIIQKNARRHFVMNHLETLILALMKRKTESKKRIDLDSSGHSRSPIGLEPTPPFVQVEINVSPLAEGRKGILSKEKSAHLVQKQLSTDSRTNSGMLKLFKQVSGNSDGADSGATSQATITPQISSSTSSKGLLGGLIPSPAPSLSQRNLIGVGGSSLSQRNLVGPSQSQKNLIPTLSHKSLFGDKPNPKTLNAKRSFSRTYSDLLARQEAGNEEVSRLLEHKEDDDDEHDGRFEKTHSLGSDLSDSQPYSPAATYRPDSPDRLDRLKSLSPRETKKSPISFSDSEEIPITLPLSSNGFPPEDQNRLSIESESTVKTSDTIKKEEPKRKPPLPDSRSSFSLSNFSLRPFTRNDKSPTPLRPNLSTITEDARRSQSSVGTPPNTDEKKFNFNNKSGPDENAQSLSTTTPPRGHRVWNSDASSLDFNFDEQGSSAHMSPLPVSSLPLCIQQLGSIGEEILTGNQKRSIVELCTLLTGGILVLKHGRSGKPNIRTLYCDEAFTTLYWSEVGKIVDGRGQVLFDASGQSQSSFHDAHLSDSVGAKFQHLLDQTTLRNMTKRRRSSLGLNGMKVFSKSNHHELLISEILEVRDDMSTDIMRRAIAKKFVDEYRKPSLVISLILRDRSINFEIEEVHWGPVFFTLQILVDFYQVRCKQRLSRTYSEATEVDNLKMSE